MLRAVTWWIGLCTSAEPLTAGGMYVLRILGGHEPVLRDSDVWKAVIVAPI